METKDPRRGQSLPRDGAPKDLAALDRVTKWAATAMSRRTLLRRATAAGAAALSIRLFQVLPVGASSHCVACESVCGDAMGGPACSTENQYCCAPGGQYCSPPLICSCGGSCTACGRYKSRTVICSDGSRSFSCPAC